MKSTIHYCLILDQSGSMNSLKNEVILSFNEQVDMILKMKKEKPESKIKLTLCTFNDVVEFKYVGQDIDLIKKLTDSDYQPDCCTALYDAIGASFVKITELSEPDDQVFLAIFTDGLENASKHYRAEDIQFKLAEAEKRGWAVNFFCRYEDGPLYKRRLKISNKNLVAMSLDIDGFKAMEDQIHFRLKKMIDLQEDE